MPSLYKEGSLPLQSLNGSPIIIGNPPGATQAQEKRASPPKPVESALGADNTSRGSSLLSSNPDDYQHYTMNRIISEALDRSNVPHKNSRSGVEHRESSSSSNSSSTSNVISVVVSSSNGSTTPTNSAGDNVMSRKRALLSSVDGEKCEEENSSEVESKKMKVV